ncbi:MAG: hypothetical protein JSW50_11035 [Candidatus Latescibacterota bacterium]|nr:MAG: hypothetical protein JSW50_11035 [Candidatus Latescibacterota bacterium]
MTLLGHAIDYAGLFPPAALDMESAVRKYHVHRNQPESWMLGRFVVPVSRLEDFNFAALDVLDGGRGEPQWKLAALVADDFRADMDRIQRFNEWHREKREDGLAVIDVVEAKADTTKFVEAAAAIVPDGIECFFEIPITDDPTVLVEVISSARAGAKVRTGGVTPDMFPLASDLARLLKICHEKDVVLKATAGLHHPLCGVKNLTYEPGSPTGRMYGFLNLLIAAAGASELMSDGEIIEALEEEDVTAFAFDELGVRWKGRFFSNDVLESVRTRSVSAFGSCSFDEPIEDLKGLRLL